jgi:hypothetical protein
MENIFTSYVMENIFYILCYGEHFYILRYGEKKIILRYREKFKDTKCVIRSRKSQNDRQSNGQNERDKKTNKDIQNTTH